MKFTGSKGMGKEGCEKHWTEQVSRWCKSKLREERSCISEKAVSMKNYVDVSTDQYVLKLFFFGEPDDKWQMAYGI